MLTPFESSGLSAQRRPSEPSDSLTLVEPQKRSVARKLFTDAYAYANQTDDSKSKTPFLPSTAVRQVEVDFAMEALPLPKEVREKYEAALAELRKSAAAAWKEVKEYINKNGTAQKKSAGELVKEQLAKRNQSTSIFASQIGNGEVAMHGALYPLTFSLSRPVAIATHEKDGKPNIIGETNFARFEDELHAPMKRFDYILIFPKSRSK